MMNHHFLRVHGECRFRTVSRFGRDRRIRSVVRRVGRVRPVPVRCVRWRAWSVRAPGRRRAQRHELINEVRFSMAVLYFHEYAGGAIGSDACVNENQRSDGIASESSFSRALKSLARSFRFTPYVNLTITISRFAHGFTSFSQSDGSTRTIVTRKSKHRSFQSNSAHSFISTCRLRRAA